MRLSPFTKTPLNIVSRAIEYSPAGLFRVLFSRNRPPEEIIELFSKGLTGTGIVLLGYLLAAWGWARGSDDTKKKGEELTKLSGDHLYSITTPNGSYKHDWAQPFSVPFFMGVVAEDKMEKQDEFSFETVFDASHISMPKGNKGKSQALPSSITSNKLIKVLKSLEHIKLSDMLKVVMRCGREKQMAELTLPQLYCVRKYRWEH
ncbi:MAG: hypothetical protein ACOX2Q_10160 [Dehalobacterium sp.]